MKVFRRPATPATYVDSRENASVHRHQMRGEGDNDFPLCRSRELLVELSHVTVMPYTVGVKAFRDFREQHCFFGRSPCARHARLGIDDNFIELDRLVLDQWNEWQLRAGRVATGIGHQSRVPDLATMDFGETVNGFLLQLGRMMLMAVPFRVGR